MLYKAFANGSSANIKLSETQFHKTRQPGEFLDGHLGLLLKTGLPLIGSLLKLLVKSVSVPLGLATAASGTDPTIHKKMLGSGTTKLIIYNKEINNMMNIIKFLDESCLLIKGISETIKIEAKNKREGFKYVIRYVRYYYIREFINR